MRKSSPLHKVLDKQRAVLVIIIITLLCALTESNISTECCGHMRPTGSYKGIMEGKLNCSKNSLCFYGMKTELTLDLYLNLQPLETVAEDFQVSLT